MRRRSNKKAETPEPTLSMDDRSSMAEPEGEPEPDVLANVSAVDEGDTVTVVWGKESFSPIRYFNVEIGPFRLTVRVRKGESPGEAIARANRILEAHADEAWEAKVRQHLKRVPVSHSIAQAMKARG